MWCTLTIPTILRVYYGGLFRLNPRFRQEGHHTRDRNPSPQVIVNLSLGTLTLDMLRTSTVRRDTEIYTVRRTPICFFSYSLSRKIPLSVFDSNNLSLAVEVQGRVGREPDTLGLTQSSKESKLKKYYTFNIIVMENPNNTRVTNISLIPCISSSVIIYTNSFNSSINMVSGLQGHMKYLDNSLVRSFILVTLYWYYRQL